MGIAAQVAASLAAKASKLVVPMQLKWVRTNRREQFEKERAQKGQDMAEEQGREERTKKFKNDKRPWTDKPKPKGQETEETWCEGPSRDPEVSDDCGECHPPRCILVFSPGDLPVTEAGLRWSAVALGAIQEATEQMPQVFLKMQTCVPSMESE